MEPTPEQAIAETQQWIQTVVIGMNLCPFARKVVQDQTIRYQTMLTTDPETLFQAVAAELTLLTETPRERIETSILIHPNVLTDFLEYNDFLGAVDELIAQQGLAGVIQVASFHPDYQFAGTRADSVENYTNRSPYPMLHFLREVSITEVSDDPEFLEQIPERNQLTLRDVGRKAMLAKLKAIREQATAQRSNPGGGGT
jgi:hypothetical protein